MTWLTSIQQQVKEYLINQFPTYWPEISAIATPVVEAAVSPEVIIPVSCCKAVGGDPEKSIPMAAGLMSVLISVRILDDLQDQDKINGLYRTVGNARAFNYSFAFMTLGYKLFNAMDCEEKIKGNIIETFDEGSLVTLAGQDRDLQGINRTWEEYWKTAEMKTCYITSSGAAMGAMLGTQNIELIQACRLYGYHWGLALQILNDLDGTWNANGETDLEKGKVTLPVLYGISCEHAERKELETIVWQNKIAQNAERVKEILDHVDTKSYLIWAALEQRKNALNAIQVCPDEEGKNALTWFLNGVFGDIDELLERNDNYTRPSFLSIPVLPRNPETFAAQKTGAAYRSIALGIRSSHRNNYN